MFLSARDLIKIESNVDYSNFDYKIYAIHCTKTNEDNVILYSSDGNSVTFPPNSFIKGAVYNIIINKVIFDEKTTSFIGYIQTPYKIK